jgi:hypothetical protein
VLLESPAKASSPLAAPNKLHYCFQHKLELLLDSLNKLWLYVYWCVLAMCGENSGESQLMYTSEDEMGFGGHMQLTP